LSVNVSRFPVIGIYLILIIIIKKKKAESTQEESPIQHNWWTSRWYTKLHALSWILVMSSRLKWLTISPRLYFGRYGRHGVVAFRSLYHSEISGFRAHISLAVGGRSPSRFCPISQNPMYRWFFMMHAYKLGMEEKGKANFVWSARCWLVWAANIFLVFIYIIVIMKECSECIVKRYSTGPVWREANWARRSKALAFSIDASRSLASEYVFLSRAFWEKMASRFFCCFTCSILFRSWCFRWSITGLWYMKCRIWVSTICFFFADPYNFWW
jgi:hypothetical protein